MKNCIVMLALLAPVLTAQNSLELEGRYWMPRMSGTLRVERGSFATDIGLREDLGIANQGFPQGSATLHRGAHRVRFQYSPIDYSGDQNVSRTVVFLGRVYTAGTRVQSDIEVRHLQLSWAYQFGTEKVRLGPMVEANGFLLRGALLAPEINPPIAEREKLGFGLPAPGFAVDIRPHPAVHVYGEFAGMKVGGYGRFIGSDAGVKVTWKQLLFSVGYRTFNLHVNDSPDFARLQIHGPFVGAGFRF